MTRPENHLTLCLWTWTTTVSKYPHLKMPSSNNEPEILSPLLLMWKQVKENSEGTESAVIITWSHMPLPQAKPTWTAAVPLCDGKVKLWVPSIYFGITVCFMHRRNTSVDLVIMMLSISDISEFIRIWLDDPLSKWLCQLKKHSCDGCSHLCFYFFNVHVGCYLAVIFHL